MNTDQQNDPVDVFLYCCIGGIIVVALLLAAVVSHAL
jgi:hypothetical protein